MTRCRRRELIMQEASVALLTSHQMQLARMQTFPLLEPRKAPKPLEFPFDTTPRKQSMTCQTRDRRMSFMIGD
jgi:hypothetical protein